MSDSFVTPWTIARQAPLSMGISGQESWSGLPFPSPGDLPWIELMPPAWQAESLPLNHLGSPILWISLVKWTRGWFKSTLFKVVESFIRPTGLYGSKNLAQKGTQCCRFGGFTMPWTARPVRRIGTFHVVQELQSDQGSTSSATSRAQRKERPSPTLPGPLLQLSTAPHLYPSSEAVPSGREH